MENAATGSYEAKLKLYEQLVATNPSVRRKGDTMPYTSLNGHMFSLFTKSGTLALRLPADDREAFLKKYKTKLCEQYGTVLKEYVEVPDALLSKTSELKRFFDLSYAYVAGLKPKPTTRTKKNATKKTAKKKMAKKKAAKKTTVAKTTAEKKAAPPL